MTVMHVLFLDDDPLRHEAMKRLVNGHHVDYVETAEAAIEALGRRKYDVACLDHDLGGKVFVPSEGPDPTGYDVARAIVDGVVLAPNTVIIHSFNPAGARRMHVVLIEAGIDAKIAPFGTWQIG